MLLCSDTMMRGFESALAGREDEHPVLAELTAPAYALLRLALIATANDIA